MFEIVFIILKNFMRVCKYLLVVFVAIFLGGWGLFLVYQGAAVVWLAIPIVLLVTITWWLQQANSDRFD